MVPEMALLRSARECCRVAEARRTSESILATDGGGLRQLFDPEAIRDALPIESYLASCGYSLRRGRGPCPLCGTSASSTAFSVRGRHWRCFACGAHGDVIDLVARLDGVPLREAFGRGAALAGLRALKRGESIPQRPRSQWLVAKEARDRAWSRYLAALKARDWAAEQFVYFSRRYGLDHAFTALAAEILATSYDTEILAEYVYDLMGEVRR